MALSSKCQLEQTSDSAESRQGWKCICAVFKGVMSGSFYSNVSFVINSAIIQVVFWHIWSSNITLQGSCPVLITQLPAWTCLCSCEAAWGPGLRLKVVQKGKKNFFLFIQVNQRTPHPQQRWQLGAVEQHCWKQMLVKLFLGRFMWQQLFFKIIWGEKYWYLCRLDYLTNIFCIL